MCNTRSRGCIKRKQVLPITLTTTRVAHQYTRLSYNCSSAKETVQSHSSRPFREEKHVRTAQSGSLQILVLVLVCQTTTTLFAQASQLRRPTTTRHHGGPNHQSKSNLGRRPRQPPPEVWAIVALHLELVGTWRLMLVYKAARVGVRDFLNTKPNGGGCCERVWRLDLATPRWEAIPALGVARDAHE